jgi:hypothetical protein
VRAGFDKIADEKEKPFGGATAPSPEANEEQLEKQGAKNALGDTSASAEPEDALGKDEAAYRVAWQKRVISQTKPTHLGRLVETG